MISEKSLIIAVDFDGTIVESKYPEIGETKIFAFETLKKLEDEGHRLILWTYRSGKRLEAAVDFCKENGITFYAVNNSYPEEEFDPAISRKINADIFIDDRNVGGFMGWGEIYHALTDTVPEIPKQTKNKKSLFSFLKK
jgi:hydroxymethylpyrimidine pyrophosphatase-like HAD family hydrolase